MSNISRQLAFSVLLHLYQHHAYIDIALDKVLQDTKISQCDRNLVSELVYGVIRRKRTLDSIINQLGNKKASQQPLKLRIILQLGLYQLRYLDKIPVSAAVNTSVDLAKENGLNKLSGVVNGILRTYVRQKEKEDFLVLPSEFIPRLGVKYSFPDWIVDVFQQQFSPTDTERLLDWYNQPPKLDLRVNTLKISPEALQQQLEEEGITTELIPFLPQCLRLTKHQGNITHIKGWKEGLFTIQDSSAQLVTHFLNPQPHETIIDACAAPGGKTTHIAELMGDKGTILAVDYYSQRLSKIQENAQRLQLNSIQILEGDSSQGKLWENQVDRVLVDVPCSGLGTLHKNPDIRWQKKPEQIRELRELQGKILGNASTWVKEGGVLVYATCTLNPGENEQIIEEFLVNHPSWQLDTKSNNGMGESSLISRGMVKIFPPRDQMDGFFMAKLVKGV